MITREKFNLLEQSTSSLTNTETMLYQASMLIVPWQEHWKDCLLFPGLQKHSVSLSSSSKPWRRSWILQDSSGGYCRVLLSCRRWGKTLEITVTNWLSSRCSVKSDWVQTSFNSYLFTETYGQFLKEHTSPPRNLLLLINCHQKSERTLVSIRKHDTH